jgi:hypothetical protein
MLHLGSVTRSVAQQNGLIGILTIGQGTGDFGILNRIGASPYWRSFDYNILVTLPIYGR